MRRELLTEARAEVLTDFRVPITVLDTEVPGLRLRVGTRRSSWIFKQQHRLRGTRTTTFEVLGHWPSMTVSKAREEAKQIAARVAKTKPRRNKTEAPRFEAALDEYVKYLAERAVRAGKTPIWSVMVPKIARRHLLPTFARWTLEELAAAPAQMRELHGRLTETAGPTTANHALKILRSVYHHASKEADPPLPPASPTRSVRFHAYEPSTKGIPFDGFKEWKAQLDLVPSPLHRTFHGMCLLTGSRPGEMLRLRRDGIDVRKRVLTIPLGKSNDKPKTISIVMSWPIARLLKTALRLHDNDLVFVGCYQYNKTDTMLPIKGHALRRTYRSVAAELGIDPVSTHLLMNHSMQGINAQYINQMMMSGAPGLRKTQARISARIIELLGIDSNARAPS